MYSAFFLENMSLFHTLPGKTYWVFSREYECFPSNSVSPWNSDRFSQWSDHNCTLRFQADVLPNLCILQYADVLCGCLEQFVKITQKHDVELCQHFADLFAFCTHEVFIKNSGLVLIVKWLFFISTHLCNLCNVKWNSQAKWNKLKRAAQSFISSYTVWTAFAW